MVGAIEFMMSSCHSYQIRLFPSFVSKKQNKWIDFVDTKPLTKNKKEQDRLRPVSRTSGFLQTALQEVSVIRLSFNAPQ